MQTAKKIIKVEYVTPCVKLAVLPAAIYAGKNVSPEEYIAAAARVSTNRTETATQALKTLYNGAIAGIVRAPFEGEDYTDNKMGGHYSVLGMVTIGFEIEGISLVLAQQLLRHQFNFQQFSQRYAGVLAGENADILQVSSFYLPTAAGDKPRNATDKPADISPELLERITGGFQRQGQLYSDLIDAGVSLETARYNLPTATATTIIASATLRQWITFLFQRLHNGAQAEFRYIANCIAGYIKAHFPILCEVLNDFKFWSIIKGCDIEGLNRYSQGLAAAADVDAADFVPFTILANRLDTKTATNEERAELSAVAEKYADKLQKVYRKIPHRKRKG